MLRLVLVAAFVAAGAAHAVEGRDLADFANRPVTLRTGIGAAHDAVGTTSKDAQGFYDQGLAYLHSYVWLEAARSFNQALRIDPQLAVAHAQLSLAFTELNAPAAASAALARAKALAATATEHDRLHIRLRELQAAAEAAPHSAPPPSSSSVPSRSSSVASGFSRTSPELEAYRAALDTALGKFPEDEELWLLRGHAESADPAERGQGSNSASIGLYRKALALAPAHAAAHHYLTHAYENIGRFDEALAEGAAYAAMAPNVPHARHMHGHDLRRVGRIDEAIEEFRAADALESAYLAAEAIPVEYDWHYQHNLDLLAASYQYQGRMREAEPLFKRSFAISSSLVEQEFNKREWPVFLRARGRMDEALAAARVMAGHRSPLISAAGHVEAGRALLRQGKFQAAADEANAALRLMRSSPEGAGLVAVPLQELQGEFFLRTGQRDKGRAALEEATRKLRAARGPDAFSQTAFAIEAIARAAREAADWEFAAWAARQLLEHDPNYAGGHYARALVAEHDGDGKTAQAEFERVKALWSKADPDLAELKR